MDFLFFNDVSSSSELDMSEISELMLETALSPPDPLMLEIGDELLSSYESWPLTLPSSSSTANDMSDDYFYFIPEISTDCTMVTDVLNIFSPEESLSMESDPIGMNAAFVLPSFSMDEDVKNEPIYFEDETSQSGICMVSRPASPLMMEPVSNETAKVFNSDSESQHPDKGKEPCTDVVLYVPPTIPAPGIVDARSNRPRMEPVLKPEMVHTKFKKPLLRCEICDRAFLNNSSLKQHLSFHQPARPYQCDQLGCTKSYKTRSELNRHLIVHSGEKKYRCIKCGKTFLLKQYLKTHLIRHNEGLTWQCSLCSKIFVSEEDLNKHKISYHGNGLRRRMIKQNKMLALAFQMNSS